MSDGPYVRYHSNNSGGDWWLTNSEWEALEAAGWKVNWASAEDRWSRQGDDGHWYNMGARATSAIFPGTSSIDDAIESFEAHTRQTASDEGCSCCGNPHSFEAYDENGQEIW